MMSHMTQVDCEFHLMEVYKLPSLTYCALYKSDLLLSIDYKIDFSFNRIRLAVKEIKLYS